MISIISSMEGSYLDISSSNDETHGLTLVIRHALRKLTHEKDTFIYSCRCDAIGIGNILYR